MAGKNATHKHRNIIDDILDLGLTVASIVWYFVGVELDTSYESGTNYHESLKAAVKLENGEEHTVEGKVIGFIPLRNRRGERITQIGEGMTEYTLDGDRVGYGLSEYLDQTS